MKRYILLATIATMVGCGSAPKQIKVGAYPTAHKDSTTDNYFGTTIADPYRWMENDTTAQVASWVAAENEVTQNYLAQIPFRDSIKNRLTQLFDYPKQGTPWREGDYYFFFKNDGLQNQSVIFYQKGLDGAPEVFLDPNSLSADGTVALAAISFSNDSKLCAYSVSVAGSDWVEIRLMDVATRAALPDVIKWVKFSGAAWGKDGFYYSRYDEPKGSALSAKNEFQKVYFHKIGTAQTADKLIYQDTQHPLRYFSGFESEDGKWLFISGSEGTSGNEILYRSTASGSAFKTLFKGFVNDFSIVDCYDNTAIVHTNKDAENFQLLSINLTDVEPSLSAKTLVGESENLLQGATTAGGALFVSHLKDASTRMTQYTLGGELVRTIELPGIGTAGGFNGKKEDKFVFYGYSSFNVPPTSYKYTIADGTSELYLQTKVNFDVSQYTVEQVFYPSKDGTKVPMFIVHKKGIKMDGTAPTLLYAYGGFNISLTPSFSPSTILLLEQGGIYALANIRGGGEYGEKWHKGGMLANKQNVFDDFIAAGEYLIAQKYTSASKLAINGGSNGGLLVGACLTQRPDLFAVAFPEVGVLDMLRYHRFTIGWGWAVEYGSADYAEQFDYLVKYSPLHTIKAGTCYPATMIMTADHDDRVVPAHSFKFAATLQEAQGCDKPILIRIDSKAGHGAGKPISKIIDAKADFWAFMLQNTNTEYKK